MNRTRKLAVAAALSAGVLTGSVAPASAVPAEPEAAHCDHLDVFTANADRRIARHVRHIERLMERRDAVDEVAHPERVVRIQRRIDRIEARITTIQERIAALEDYCAPAPTDEVPEGEA